MGRAAYVGGPQSTPAVGQGLARLEIFRDGFPRAFVFRQAEMLGGRLPYAEWEAQMSQLDGIIGKLERDILPTVSERNVEYFRRFKRRYPEKLVLLHLDGLSWLAEFEPGMRSPHWLYAAGTVLEWPVTPGDELLRVADPRLFRDRVGRLADRGDEAVVVARGADGRPRWERSEHVRVRAVDRAGGALRVERAVRGSRPLPFAAGAFVAPHIGLGPYCADCERTWVLNYATAGPRDAAGRSGGRAFADSLSRKIGPGGALSFVDGVQLDGFPFRPLRPRFADVDFDQHPDGGVVDGRQSYGLGALAALEALRDRLGDAKIIATDGGAGFQRPHFGVLNGIELEGFTGDLRDPEMECWTSRLNLLGFAQEHVRRPGLNYVNHKYAPQVAYPIDYANFRMALAATQFTGTLFTFFIEPGGGSLRHLEQLGPAGTAVAEVVTVFDELVKGSERRANWLGHPAGPARHLAQEAPDLLAGRGRSWDEPFVAGLAASSPPGTHWRRLDDGRAGVRVAAPGAAAVRFAVELPGGRDPDLLVVLRMTAAPLADHPGLARRVTVSAGGAENSGLAGPRPFASRFYLRGVGPGSVRVEITVEGGEPVEIEELTAHSAADFVFREFDGGLVLANPSTRPLRFALAERFPGAAFRRLRGTPEQDPATNDGRPVGPTVVVPAEDALFLTRRAEPRLAGVR